MLTRVLATIRRVGVDYACFHVYSLPLAAGGGVELPAGLHFRELRAADLDASPHAELRACRPYLGEEAYVFGIFRDGVGLACAQCIWFGERFRRIAFWPITTAEATSMHLVTAPCERGKGLATWAKLASAQALRERGFTRLYSRIWWTNRPSLRVSEKAGWSRVGTTFELKLPSLDKAWVFTFPLRGTTGAGRGSSSAEPR